MKYLEMGIDWDNKSFAVRDVINEFYEIYYMFNNLKDRLDDLWKNRFPAFFNSKELPIEIYMKIYDEEIGFKIEVGESITKIFQSYGITFYFLLGRFEHFVLPNLTKKVEEYINENNN